MSLKCHFDKKTNRRYDVILGRDLLIALLLDLNFSINIIIGDEGKYEGCLAPMVYLSNYDFKSSTKKS